MILTLGLVSFLWASVRLHKMLGAFKIMLYCCSLLGTEDSPWVHWPAACLTVILTTMHIVMAWTFDHAFSPTLGSMAPNSFVGRVWLCLEVTQVFSFCHGNAVYVYTHSDISNTSGWANANPFSLVVSMNIYLGGMVFPQLEPFAICACYLSPWKNVKVGLLEFFTHQARSK